MRAERFLKESLKARLKEGFQSNVIGYNLEKQHKGLDSI